MVTRTFRSDLATAASVGRNVKPCAKDELYLWKEQFPKGREQVEYRLEMWDAPNKRWIEVQ